MLLSRKQIFENPKIIGFLLKVYNALNFKNRVSLNGATNKLVYNVALMDNVKIRVYGGHDNKIILDDFSRLINCTIDIYGSGNVIIIGKRCYINSTSFYFEDNNNKVSIDEHTSINGPANMAAIEGTSIVIGKDCMLSGNIDMRTGDSHSILDLDGNRINASKNINIGNHVWIGQRVMCLKGTKVADNCILGAGSIVSGEFMYKNAVIAGVPGKVVKESINWCRARI